MATVTGTPLIEALRKVPVLEDLKEDQLQWFASNAEDLHFEAGEVVVEAGAPADQLIVILAGELQGKRPTGGGRLYSRRRRNYRNAAVLAHDAISRPPFARPRRPG